MSDDGFDAIDSLLSSVTEQAALPDPDVRRELRERAHLSKAQVAKALGVSPSTLSGWESGRDPSGETRTKYAYLLDGLAAKFATQPPAAELLTVEDDVDQADADPGSGDTSSEAEGEGPVDDVEVLAVPELCVLCGTPASHRMDGFAQHLDPADCRPASAPPAPASAPAPAEPVADTNATPAPARTAPAPKTPPPVSERPGRLGRPASRSAPSRGVRSGGPAAPAGKGKPPRGRAFQEESGPGALIVQAVRAALAEHGGDVDEATAALVKKAIPDAMVLLDETRKGARYDVVAHPALPKVLRKQTAKGADQVWEARPKWTRAAPPPGVHEVTALDMNAAYLSALKTHLPIGQLEHSTGFDFDRRRAGIHLITPPAWDHGDVLPNPIGNRDEPGPLWVTEPTLRLLLRLSGPKHQLCAPPVIHESYTSGSTENLLEKFRITLTDARAQAIEAGDIVTLEYVKAMYSKLVSTMGESNYNRELYRQDWMHLIRSQAFANLWMKAWKAHTEGLQVVRAMGTDELHVIGDWRQVFPEGRGVTEVKVKDTYTVGTTDATGEGE
ncbi:helix-turn-helix transcriptional regulator [Streptomyces sp. NPDC020875]|uniref:helix-turn-helix domain-containing protein n=1 Tax=Streptomyces sp. NPDC020875 TaxID=3154898 RepID=UPI0033C55635